MGLRRAGQGGKEEGGIEGWKERAGTIHSVRAQTQSQRGCEEWITS